MKIIIAPDSFKESLTADAAAEAIRRGFAEVLPDADYLCIPLADGGEGTTDALLAACGGERIDITVEDPLGRPVRAHYALLADGTAVLEMAEASGLHLLAPDERNPRIASTFGTGQMLADALARGVRRIILGIGGSATNDGGAGMAEALGFRFLDADGAALPRGGAALARLARVDGSAALPALAACAWTVACDVRNPLCGANGASHVFAPQKGADAAMVAELDAALAHFADVLAAQGYPDRRDEAGSGAAGGLGFGLRTLLNATLQPGIDLVLQASGMEKHLADADLLITGEGRMDGQTAYGKVPLGVATLAQRHRVPVIAIAGSVSADVSALHAHGFAAIFPSVPGVCTLDDALANATANLQRTAREVAALWVLGRNGKFSHE